MKKIFNVMLIALLIVGLCVVSEARTKVKPALSQALPNGAIIQQNGGTIDVPLRTYRIVRYWYHTTTIGSGVGTTTSNGDYRLSNDSVMVWDDSTSGDDGITVTTSGLSADSRVAGVMVYGIGWVSTDAHIVVVSQDTNSRTWGYLQTQGIGWVRMHGPVTTGEPVGTVRYHGVAGPAKQVMGGARNALSKDTANRLGIALDANTAVLGDAAVPVKVMIMCD